MNTALMPRSSELIPTRQSLLSRLRNLDDQESWKDFFDTYWKLIYGVAVKAGLTEVEAQEVVQETVICVAKKMPGFVYDPTTGSFKAWLLKLTRWRIADQMRNRQRARAVQHISASTATTATVERMPDPAADFDQVWETEWQKNIFDAAVANVKQKVSPRQYQIFDLYAVQKWPIAKVAQTLGVNVGQVYLARHRITKLVKQEVRNLEANLK